MFFCSATRKKSILVIVAFFLFNLLHAQHTSADFDFLNVETGLSHNSILSVIQDKNGYLWFASIDGLNRFDGYNIKIYNHAPGDSSSLSGNELNTLFIDDIGSLWVGTYNGLSRYDVIHDNFFNFLHDENVPFSLSNSAVWSIAQDPAGNLWVGTENGLNRLSKDELHEKNRSVKDYRFTHFKHDSTDKTSLSNSLVWSILFDNNNNGWVGTNKGLNRFSNHQINSNTIQFEHFLNEENNSNSITTNIVWQLYLDHSGNLWLSSYDGMLDMIPSDRLDSTIKISHYLPQIEAKISHKEMGVLNILQDNEHAYWVCTNGFGLINFQLIQKNNSEQRDIRLMGRYVNDLTNNKSLSNNTVYQIFQDISNTFWIATADGISIYNPEKRKFNNSNIFPNFSIVEGKQVSTIYGDKNKNMFIGTLSDGLYFLPLNDNSKSLNAEAHLLKDKAIQTFSVDIEDNFWIGTNQGIFMLSNDEFTNAFSNNFLTIPGIKNYNKKNTPALCSDIILSMCVDKKGNIWIGTGNGLNVWNYKKKALEIIVHKASSSQVSGATIIRCLYALESGIVVAGTDMGLFQFDPSIYPFAEKKPGDKYPSVLNELRISSLFEKEDKTLWIGTNGRGLCRYDKSKESVKFYTSIDGLPNNVINAIVDDSEGNLWLSTNNGISKFNIETEAFSNYNENDGLKSNSFSLGAAYKSDNGEIFFGNNKGLNSFYPDKITKNSFIPPIRITDFKIFDKSVFGPGFEKTKNTLLNDNFVQLDYNQNFFSFEFAALNYINSEKNQYKYMLKGVDADWVNNGTRRFASYTNIDPGTYTFLVKGSNNDGVWNEKGTTITIKIIPPYYKTWWFRGVMAFVFAALIFFVTQIRIKAIRQTKEKEVIEHSARMKEQFLANMSHEIRTPMNAIVGMTRLLIEKEPRGDQKRYLNAIEQSSDNLLVIINDILDFSKIEAGKLELEYIPYSISALLDGVYSTMQFKIKEKGLQLSYEVAADVPAAVSGDRVRLNEVFLNLVGNAIKFTHHGNIKVSCFNKGNCVDNNGAVIPNRVNIEFSVSDTGIGIPEDRLESIFESFSQASSDTTRKFGGTGLGLTISKHLVELHGGKISVKSQPGNGTVFTFVIPFDIADSSLIERENKFDEKTHLQYLSRLKLLLTEDNEFNQMVAVDTLTNYIPGISIDIANNGKEAVDKVTAGNYDLILMDIQMPEMDGYTATQLIRKQLLPPKNEIKIMAMTAGALKSEIQKCYEAGMDDYISKPFDPHLLIEKMSTLFPDQNENMT